jgi:hypothetical protein
MVYLGTAKFVIKKFGCNGGSTYIFVGDTGCRLDFKYSGIQDWVFS